MIRYILGPDNMPAIYPYPKKCIWTGEVFPCGKRISLFADPFFWTEIRYIQKIAEEQGVSILLAQDKDAMVRIQHKEALKTEEYVLNIDERGTQIDASTARGAWYAMITLLQLIQHVPDDFLAGVYIRDWPSKRRRPVTLPNNFSIRKNTNILGDFFARYKINEVILSEKTYSVELEESLKKYCVKIRLDKSEGDCDCGMGRLLWQAGEMWCGEGWIPDYHLRLKNCTVRMISQLCNKERQKIRTNEEQLSEKGAHKAVDLREYYNVPLYRLQWNEDDFDFRFLEEATPVPGSIPFNLLQGVGDSRTDMALILSGNQLNNGVCGIKINDNAYAVSILHARIAGAVLRRTNKVERKSAGKYVLYYEDGSDAVHNIIDGRDIAWGDFDIEEGILPDADIAYAGYNKFGQKYVLYSYMWKNPYPEKRIIKMDILPDENNLDDGVMVFGITLLKKEERYEGE